MLLLLPQCRARSPGSRALPLVTSLTEAPLPCQMQLCFLARLEPTWSREYDKSEDKGSKCAEVQRCRVCVQSNTETESVCPSWSSHPLLLQVCPRYWDISLTWHVSVSSVCCSPLVALRSCALRLFPGLQPHSELLSFLCVVLLVGCRVLCAVLQPADDGFDLRRLGRGVVFRVGFLLTCIARSLSSTLVLRWTPHASTPCNNVCEGRHGRCCASAGRRRLSFRRR